MGPIGRALGLDDVHALRHLRGALLYGGAACALGLVATVFVAVAVYAALVPSLGPLGAAAAVAVVAGLLAALSGLGAIRHAHRAKRRLGIVVKNSAIATAAPAAAAMIGGKLGLFGSAAALVIGFLATRYRR
jgi:hypothetical protein